MFLEWMIEDQGTDVNCNGVQMVQKAKKNRLENIRQEINIKMNNN